jgi:glyoxylase-like metal-dependent hydrolase (beta-lactamase superfamily II)
MGMKIKRFLTSVNDSNCYLCWCDVTGEGALVDPSEFNDDIRQAIRGNNIELTGILITHGHYDHNGAVPAVREEFDATVYAAGNYPNGVQVSDDDVIEIGNVAFYVASTPGHTEDSVSFIAEGIAFVGDALFAAAVGGTSSRPYFEREVQGIRENLFTLPGCTILYPGHGPATTVAVESCYNPFFV